MFSVIGSSVCTLTRQSTHRRIRIRPAQRTRIVFWCLLCNIGSSFQQATALRCCLLFLSFHESGTLPCAQGFGIGLCRFWKTLQAVLLFSQSVHRSAAFSLCSGLFAQVIVLSDVQLAKALSPITVMVSGRSMLSSVVLFSNAYGATSVTVMPSTVSGTVSSVALPR